MVMSQCAADEACPRPVKTAGLCSTHYTAHRRATDPTLVERRKARWAERRAWLNAYKLKRRCADCGYRRHPEALQFDHRDPASKTFVVSRMIGRSWKLILAEIEKCDVVCANCHAIRTARNRTEVK